MPAAGRLIRHLQLSVQFCSPPGLREGIFLRQAGLPGVGRGSSAFLSGNVNFGGM
jgi:hypothetical protein